jgi:undecaprenyl-diphosphatase
VETMDSLPLWLSIVILGIIEGITEFLPISSTGHLLIAQRWLPRQSDLFNIVIQSGAVIAVIPLFRERVVKMLLWRTPEARDYAVKILVAFFITGVLGLVLDWLGFELPETILPVAVALLVGGLAFVLIERSGKAGGGSSEITWWVVLAVGLGQILAAVFPGTSRSGSTIILLLLLGMARPAATEFSFLVGIPTMLAAGALKIAKELKATSEGGAAGEDWGMLALGFLVSAVVSFAAVKWLLGYVRSHTFEAFGWYRLGLAAVLLLLLAFNGAT